MALETLEIESSNSTANMTSTVSHLLPISCQYEGTADEQALCDLWCQIQVGDR